MLVTLRSSVVGHPLRIGLKLSQQVHPIEAQREAWRIADEAGFDHIWPFDHLIALGNDPTRLIFDGWTILGAVAENTKRTRIGLNVTGIPYRHPGLLAKIAVTVDHLSGGRLEMGIGAAWNEPEFKMYGIPFPSTADRIRAMDEACSVLKALWTEERASFKGRYYQLDAAIAEPKPLQKPYPPIWIGGVGPKLTLRVVAKHADVWNSNAPTPADTVKLTKILDEHCTKVGRDPAAIRRSSQLRAEDEDGVLRIAETTTRAGFTELLVFPFGGGDLRSGVERAAALLPRLRALAA
jgi:F420-dependent oxidoreductase-like protein